MDKLKKKFQNLSLKKSLLLVSAVCLSTVCILSAVTILFFSGMRQRLLDLRPVIITDYVLESSDSDTGGKHILPQEYRYGTLSGNQLILCRCATILMVFLPIVYIISGSVFLAGLYYRLKLRAPMQELRSGIAHISGQDLDFRMEYISDDELGRLCGAFEQMKNEISESNRRMWDTLQQRKALTASVSHDLRTPITVVRGYLDYLDRSLENGSLSRETLELTVRNMASAAERLERYVDCVKDIQKIEEIEIRREPIALQEFLSDLSDDFSVLAQRSQKLTEFSFFSESIQIETDREMLAKVLENIFDNALRFAGEKIIFTASQSGDFILLSVLDDGRGFTQQELSAAPSLFYSSPDNGGCFGIGLSICRILCGKLGYALHLENRSPHGAAVTVRIPKDSLNFSQN